MKILYSIFDTQYGVSFVGILDPLPKWLFIPGFREFVSRHPIAGPVLPCHVLCWTPD